MDQTYPTPIIHIKHIGNFTFGPVTHATILDHDNNVIVVNDLTIRDKNFPVLEVIKMMSSMETESLL